MRYHDYIKKIDEDKSKLNVSDSVVGESSEKNNEESNGSQGSNNLIEQSTVSNENNHPSTLVMFDNISYLSRILNTLSKYNIPKEIH
jgi:hypothetical protein